MILILIPILITYYGLVLIFLLERRYMSKRNFLIDLIPGGAILRFLLAILGGGNFIISQIKESYQDLP